MTRSSFLLLLAAAGTAISGEAMADGAAPAFMPYKKDSIYALGEAVGWKVTAPATTPATNYTYVVRKNNLEQIGAGTFASGESTVIETQLDEPGMIYVEITSDPPPAKPPATPMALGAAVAPEKIGAAIPAPQDFDAFWAANLRALRKVPPKPQLTPKPSGKEGVDFAILRMDHIDGKHVWGQVARPHAAGQKKFPGLLMFQWASPPYPLQKDWITGHAADGWLVVNIEPHDVLPDAPKEYYDALPEALKNYHTIETRNRDQNYFKYMYLADIRAIDYLASRPDWDGKTIVVMGTSMGGQQSLCAAGLHPKVTALVVNMPSGADANGTAHGRRTGYPSWDANDPKVMETAQYFDSVNCAMRIKAPSLLAMGFVDTGTPPVGIWAAFNAIQAPKEVAPMPESPHNYLATAEQQAPYTKRSAAWLSALLAGRPPIERADVATPRTDPNSRVAHERLLAKRQQGRIDVYFLGDSITRRWGTSDAGWKDLYANWKLNFFGWNAANFGWGGDTTQNILWRLENGELDGVQPKVVVLMAGTNNIGNATPLGDAAGRAAEVARGIEALAREIRRRAPEAALIVTGITPRSDNVTVMPIVDAVNAEIAKLDDRKLIRYININGKLADARGRLLAEMTDDGLHLTPKAYQVWADALKPIFAEILGTPAAEDHAPPPTGDPSVAW